MALQKDRIEERFGINLRNAYFKISYIHWSAVDNTFWCQVTVWATPTAEAEGKEALEILNLDISEVFPDIRGDIYTHLKTLPELNGSIDV